MKSTVLKQIKVLNLTKKFNDRTVFENISFEIEKGEFVFIIGKSGEGKSVLGRCISALETPDSGEIYFEGVLLNRLSEEELLEFRKKCIYVFQNPCLFDSMNVFDNITFPLKGMRRKEKKERESLLMEIAKQAEIYDYLNQFPKNLPYSIQKRVSIVRAISLLPHCLILDEPESGASLEDSRKLLKIVLNLKKEFGFTLILISHHREIIKENYERILFLKGKGVIDIKSLMDELKKYPEIRKFLDV